jgi:hypothetical protein
MISFIIITLHPCYIPAACQEMARFPHAIPPPTTLPRLSVGTPGVFYHLTDTQHWDCAQTLRGPLPILLREKR